MRKRGRCGACPCHGERARRSATLAGKGRASKSTPSLSTQKERYGFTLVEFTQPLLETLSTIVLGDVLRLGDTLQHAFAWTAGLVLPLRALEIVGCGEQRGAGKQDERNPE